MAPGDPPHFGSFCQRDPSGYTDGMKLSTAYFGLKHTDPTGQKVFWCARYLNLPGGDWPGNHSFIWIEPDDLDCLNDVELKKLHEIVRVGNFNPTYEEGERVGVSIGGHNKDGDLVVIFNEPSDISSMQEFYCDKCKSRAISGYQKRWKTECHRVDPPQGTTDCEFIKKLVKLAQNYQSNEAPPYHPVNSNCASLANSIFKGAGIAKRIRTECGEFWGVDWGEEILLNDNLFKECTSPPGKVVTK